MKELVRGEISSVLVANQKVVIFWIVFLKFAYLFFLGLQKLPKFKVEKRKPDQPVIDAQQPAKRTHF